MGRSFSLGRVWDIEVKLHPTFGLVVLWVLFSWGDDPGGGFRAAMFGLLLVGLVFGCVLLHELGHSVMAMHYGVRVHDVTLSAIGGVARVEHFPMRPAAEALIALAGPAINLAILVALAPVLALYGLLEGLSWPSGYVTQLSPFNVSLGGLLFGLFVANLTIVIFNLLPAFPMDGGRILRAGLAAVVGRESGTRAAVVIAYVIACLMSLVAIIWLRSPWVPLIALFIGVMAYAEGQAVRVEGSMRRMRVGQFALWDLGGIAPQQPLRFALRGGLRDIAVTDGGRVVGMLWRNRLLQELHAGLANQTVADVMDRDVLTARGDQSVYDVHQLMNQHDRWAIPIIEDGQYRGIFTADRLIHVYRQLAPAPLNSEPVAGLAAALHRVIRLVAR